MEVNVLAIDLGASSGRGITARYDGNEIRTEEVYRFPNGAKERSGRLEWDLDALFEGACAAVRAAVDRGVRLDGIGIDSWGVDYGLIGKDGKPLCAPRHYRDPAHTLMRREMRGRAFEFYKIAGVSDNDFNTTYQLLTRKAEGFDFSRAESLLFIPQLIGYLFSGERITEPTIASTSGFYSKDKGFDESFLAECGLGSGLFPPNVAAGNVSGRIKRELCNELNLPYGVPVTVCPGHDTACAVATLCRSRDYLPLYLISGTWSLFGTLTDRTVITERAFLSGYTNELAADGRVRLLKNIIGMWIIQECMREWKAQGKGYDYSEITKLAAVSDDGGAYFDVNDSFFLPPGQMCERVRNRVRSECGKDLKDDGALARCVFRSMAKAYAVAYRDLKAVTGKEYDELHVLGGGVNNGLLNSFVSEELGIPVRAGYAEASALGNALYQIRALTGEFPVNAAVVQER